MKKIKEEIGRNYKTIDPTPIDFFHDSRVSVEISPTELGDFAVSITAPELKYKSGMRKFGSEEEATAFARNEYTRLITQINNTNMLEERLFIRVLQRLQRK